MIKGFPHYQQLDEMDCGSTSLRMIAKYYGKEYSAEMLRNHCHIPDGQLAGIHLFSCQLCRVFCCARLL